MLLCILLLIPTALNGEVFPLSTYVRSGYAGRSKYGAINIKQPSRDHILSFEDEIENQFIYYNYNPAYGYGYRYGSSQKPSRSFVERIVEFFDKGLQKIRNDLFSVNIERQLANVSPFAVFITAATGIATVGTIAQTGVFDEILSLIDDLINPTTTTTIAATVPTNDIGTCNDNIQNGDETGIDCGGRCNSCPRIRGQVEVLPTGDHTSTLIWLHGLGDNCARWKNVLLTLQSANMKTICPEASIIPVTAEFAGHQAGAPIPAWFDFKTFDIATALTLPEDEEGIKASSAAIHKIIEDEISSGIISSRIVVGGFSQGSAMSIYSTLTNKNDMGGLLAISGYFPLRNSFPGAAEEINKDVQALQVHGTADIIAPYDPVATLTNALMSSFMTNLEFKTYQGLGHDMIAEEILYIKAFLDRILATNP